MAATTIDEVLHRLGEIIDQAKLDQSRVGYFAALYLRVTNTIRKKIGTGYFDDDARMGLLDVTFANHYLQAYDQYRHGQPTPKAWAIAFKALMDDDLLVVQQLILAMNPHINIDLGSAAAQVAPGDTSWTGSFNFKVTSWANLWHAKIGLKNKFLVLTIAVFQKIFGNGSISSVITAHPDQGVAGVAHNNFLIKKSWFKLFRSDENYILSANGSGVEVDANVCFGPISLLFREHDIYPARIYDGGMSALYAIKLLGTEFTGHYTVREDRKQVHSILSNDFAIADETLNKIPTD